MCQVGHSLLVAQSTGIAAVVYSKLQLISNIVTTDRVGLNNAKPTTIICQYICCDKHVLHPNYTCLVLTELPFL